MQSHIETIDMNEKTFDIQEEPTTVSITEESSGEDDSSTSQSDEIGEQEAADAINSVGAVRMMAFMKYIYAHKHKKILLGLFFVFIYLVEWSYAFCFALTTSLSPLATSSYEKHSQGLACLNIATTIISAVCRPFLAKIADKFSRPTCYIVVILFMMIGNVVVASSTTISAYIVGAAVSYVGISGIDFINSLIFADITPLKWRGFALSILTTPYIYNCWFSSLVLADLQVSKWRWGYGMFAIMVTVLSIPIISLMFYYEHRAVQEGEEDEKHPINRSNICQELYQAFVEVDGLGLILLGTGFTILLLPLSLYSTAQNQWKNPSIIAMFIVGGVILIGFIIYENLYCSYPIMPRRVWNKTLICCVACDFFYQLATQVAYMYFTSYTYVVLGLSLKEWSYFNNAITVSTCFFSVVTGLLHRVTQRYKMWQIFGLCLQVISAGILLKNGKSTVTLASLAASTVLSGMGGGFTTVSASVALQASVPHNNLGISISFMSLFSNFGASIGYAVAAVIWEAKMYNSLRSHLPSTVSDDDVSGFFESIYAITAYPVGTEIRDGAISAYQEVNFLLFAIQLGVSFIPLIVSFFQSNYILDDKLNTVDGDGETGRENQLEKAEMEAER